MDISTIALLIFILVIDVVLIRRDIKNKLIFAGIRKFAILLAVGTIAFIALALVTYSFKLENVIVCIEILPLVFVGNKVGITEKGFIFNSYVAIWDKIESYSFEEKEDKYIVYFKINGRMKKISFKLEDKDEVKKYLSGIKQLRYKRK